MIAIEFKIICPSESDAASLAISKRGEIHRAGGLISRNHRTLYLTLPEGVAPDRFFPGMPYKLVGDEPDPLLDVPADSPPVTRRRRGKHAQ